MFLDMNPGRRRRLALGLAVFAYFVAFPGDLEAVLGPFKAVLELSASVATGAYLLLGLLVVAGVVLRVWGRGPKPEARPVDRGPTLS